MSTEPQLIRCLHDRVAGDAGGLASVHWLGNVPAEQVTGCAEAIVSSGTQVTSTAVFVAGHAGNFIAASYTSTGRPIRFCGLGSLAAAWVVLNQYEPSASLINFSSGSKQWQARRRADTDIVLSYKRPAPTDCAVPDFAADVLGCRPMAAATVGAASDYLILVLDNVAAVQHLQPDFAAISTATPRALVVTARDTANNSCSCAFRYFAPQYGVPEDSATGSAAVQLAAYWCPRMDTQELVARQLSASGARMRLACRADTVEFSGLVEYG